MDEKLELTPSMNVMVSFFTIPSKFIKLLKVFVQVQQKAYFSLLSQYVTVDGTLVLRQVPELDFVNGDVSTLAYIDLIKLLPHQPEKDKTLPVFDSPEWQQCYFQNQGGRQKEIIIIQRCAQEIAQLGKKGLRKLFNTRTNKSSYQIPQIGYQTEKHPLIALMLFLYGYFLKLRVQLI